MEKEPTPPQCPTPTNLWKSDDRGRRQTALKRKHELQRDIMEKKLDRAALVQQARLLFERTDKDKSGNGPGPGCFFSCGSK